MTKLILSVWFCLMLCGWVGAANAQLPATQEVYSPGKSCKKLYKKRTKRPLFLFRWFRPKPKVKLHYPASHDYYAYRKKISKKKPDDPEENKVTDSLPKTFSAKHARIRKEVQDNLKDIPPSEPLHIVESLYFITDQDEFAFVDMEPFLIAVEYALQGRIILVEGHTDDRGDAAYNLELSMKRVERIRQLMLDIGVPDERISVMGYGESQPQFDNETEEGRQKNRRVDFKIF